jgi:hypothetical protein
MVLLNMNQSSLTLISPRKSINTGSNSKINRVTEPNNTVRIKGNLLLLSGILFEFTNSINVKPNNHNGPKGRARINSRKSPTKNLRCRPAKNQLHGQPRHKSNYPWQTDSQTLTSDMPLHHLISGSQDFRVCPYSYKKMSEILLQPQQTCNIIEDGTDVYLTSLRHRTKPIPVRITFFDRNSNIVSQSHVNFNNYPFLVTIQLSSPINLLLGQYC